MREGFAVMACLLAVLAGMDALSEWPSLSTQPIDNQAQFPPESVSYA